MWGGRDLDCWADALDVRDDADAVLGIRRLLSQLVIVRAGLDEACEALVGLPERAVAEAARDRTELVMSWLRRVLMQFWRHERGEW